MSWTTRKYWIGLMVTLLALLGLYTSFKASFACNVANSDISDTAMLWYGLHQQGWFFIKNWFYNQDNWLLSLFPIHFILFEIFSPSPTTVIWSGYLFLLANLLMCAWIAKNLNSPISAIVVPLILLFSSSFVYFGGLITFAVSHIITNLYGMLCLFFLIKWTKNPSPLYTGLIFFLTTTAGFSDPWFVPCYSLPMIGAQLIRLKFAWHSNLRWPLLRFIFALLLAMIIIKTKILGIFHFVPDTKPDFASFRQVISHIGFLIKDLGWLFNLWPSPFKFAHFMAIFPGIFSFGAILFLTVMVFIQVKKNISFNHKELFVFFLTALFSIISIMLCFCLFREAGPHIENFSVSRYLINIVFLLTLAISLGIENYPQQFSLLFKVFAAGVAILYGTTGIVSTLPFWKHPYIIRMGDHPSLIKFLSSHQLTYGYADYWKANVISWISNHKIQIRSIVFSQQGTLLPLHTIQTSALWYLPSDAPKNQPDFFVILDQEDHRCPVMQTCIKSVIQQLGTPEKILSYKKDVIIVWSHPLSLPPLLNM